MDRGVSAQSPAGPPQVDPEARLSFGFVTLPFDFVTLPFDFVTLSFDFDTLSFDLVTPRID